MSKCFIAIALVFVVSLAGCSSDRQHSDLDKKMSDARTRPQGVIEPLPEYPEPDRFNYSALALRSPFEAPGCAARIDLVPMANELDKVSDLDAWHTAARDRVEGDHVRLPRRVKLFADGAYFGQNMRMNPPGYTDGHLGKWITEPTDFTRQVRRYWEAGFSLHIHVNGDEGLDVVLNTLEPVITGQRSARQEPASRIEVQGLVNHSTNVGQGFKVVCAGNAAFQYGLGFGACAVLRLRVMPHQIERPSKGLGRSLMARDDKCQQIVAQFLCGHGAVCFRILRRKQQVQQIGRILRTLCMPPLDRSICNSFCFL